MPKDKSQMDPAALQFVQYKMSKYDGRNWEAGTLVELDENTKLRVDSGKIEVRDEYLYMGKDHQFTLVFATPALYAEMLHRAEGEKLGCKFFNGAELLRTVEPTWRLDHAYFDFERITHVVVRTGAVGSVIFVEGFNIIY
ncbi:hypothetical protein [Pseudomonas fluorescens]|uniref:hypothetical protein n=1 Tax=Pseudomonas fluorescens TaxID=294 RepID=UPI001782818D|nr:hypothetical protein [Pseudomonas fluorescens]